MAPAMIHATDQCFLAVTSVIGDRHGILARGGSESAASRNI
jgi:hypothetical protein